MRANDFAYFLALLVQALIERELRRTMHREGFGAIALYPEARPRNRPTNEQIFGLFRYAERHTLYRNDPVQIFDPKLTPLQRRSSTSFGVPEHTLRS